MENRVEKIKKLCEEHGLSEAEVLREADASSVTLQNWSKNEPKSFQIYDAIIAAIEKLSKKETVQ